MEKNKSDSGSDFAILPNSLFSNSFFIFITRFFPSLANLLVVIWYSRYLPQAVYGQYQQFWIQLNVIYPLACFGIHVLIITYSRAFILNLLRSISARYYALYMLWLLLLGIAFALLQCNSLSLPFVIPFLFILAYALSLVFESFLIVCRNYKLLTAVNILYSISFCVIHMYVLKNGFSLPELFTYLLIITITRLLIYAGASISNMAQREVIPAEHFVMSNVRSLWLHLGFYDVTQMLFTWIDKFIVSLVLTAQLSAVYYNGSQNIPFLPLLLSAAGSAVLIQLAGNSKQDETQDIIRLMNQSGKMLSCIVFPLFFFLLFFRHELFFVLFWGKYTEALPVFAVAVLVLPVKSYSFTTALQRLHKGGIINAGSVADIVLACALMYPLYLWLGLPGIALSFVITTYLQAAFYLFCSANLLHTSPLKLIPYMNWLIKLIVFASLFIIIRYVTYRYCTSGIVLILGGIATVIIVIASLGLEMKKQSKDVGTS